MYVWFDPAAMTVTRASPVSRVEGSVQDQVHLPSVSDLMAETPSKIKLFPSGEIKLIWQIAPGTTWIESDTRSPGLAGEVMERSIMPGFVDVATCVRLTEVVAVMVDELIPWVIVADGEEMPGVVEEAAVSEGVGDCSGFFVWRIFRVGVFDWMGLGVRLGRGVVVAGMV